MKVTIEKHNGRLRLRWQYEGIRRQLAVGAHDNPMGWAIAKTKQSEIEKDLLTGYYDPTLLKYKPQTRGKNATIVKVPELFQRFTDYQFKDKGLAPGSMRRYVCVQAHLERSLNIACDSIGDRSAGDFAALLLEKVSNRTAKEYLWLLRSCWDWAKGKYRLSDDNPWTEQIQRIKPQPQQRVKPFTATEIQAILAGFRTSEHYSYYADFVTFLFGTGCRFGEAAGLRWKHISDESQTAWIGESVSRGHRKDTKTGKSRTISLPPSVASMLKARKEQSKTSKGDDSLVFPSPNGLPINDHTFRARAWKTILEQCSIEYRKIYTMRHSAISHSLAAGANPIALAEQTGHNPKILLDVYAHEIERRSLFVEF